MFFLGLQTPPEPIGDSVIHRPLAATTMLVQPVGSFLQSGFEPDLRGLFELKRSIARVEGHLFDLGDKLR